MNQPHEEAAGYCLVSRAKPFSGENPMNRFQAAPYVAFVVDDAGAGRPLGDDLDAILRNGEPDFRYPSVLVGWQCEFEPLFVAVHSYLDTRLDDHEAEELATEFLVGQGWFDGSDRRDHQGVALRPDYIIR